MRLYLCFIYLLFSSSLFAQEDELQVKSFYLDGNSAIASTKMVYDARNKPCALLIVEISGECKFEGEVVKDIQDIGEYHVYMCDKAKKIKIKTTGCPPLELFFNDLNEDIQYLMAKHTYVLKLALPTALARPEVELSVKVLRNGTDDKHESVSFKDGDTFYLKFKSPVDGFVSVFLQNDDKMERLLPYKQSNPSAFAVKANEEYLFFSQQNNKDLSHPVDEIVLGTDNINGEKDDVCIVFSKNKYNIPTFMENGASLDLLHNKNIFNYPPFLPYRTFIKWIEENKSIDIDMQSIKIPITITL